LTGKSQSEKYVKKIQARTIIAKVSQPDSSLSPCPLNRLQTQQAKKSCKLPELKHNQLRLYHSENQRKISVKKNDRAQDVEPGIFSKQ